MASALTPYRRALSGAFDDGGELFHDEVAHVLDRATDYLMAWSFNGGDRSAPLRDSNGNTVGTVTSTREG